MSTLIIVESHFGNTWRVGEAIAAARPDSTLVRVDEAPERINDSVELLVLGAPTHAFSLPSAESRKAAGQRDTVGAKAAADGGFRPSARGLREWIEASSIPAGTRVLTFDTCVKGVGPLLGRAAKRAVKRLAGRGAEAHYGETFWVTGADELLPGETERAARWGAEQRM